MRTLLCIFAILAGTLSLPAKDDNIDMDLLSESLGHLLIRHFETPKGLDLSLEKVYKGMKEEKKKKPSPLNEEEYEQMMGLLQEKLFEETSLSNLAKADEFLLSNKKNEGVICINDKLQYQVITEGTGAVVENDSTPMIHFKGSLLNGTNFTDSGGKEPISMPLSQTIEGFAKGICGMREGETRKLFVHPELAFGKDGHLPPNSLLIFEVSVIKSNQIASTPALTDCEETAAEFSIE